MLLASATIIRRKNILIEMNIVSKYNAFMILFMPCDPSSLFCLLVAQHAHATQFRKRLPKSEIDITHVVPVQRGLVMMVVSPRSARDPCDW
jgi:hypothetical protein